MYERGYHPDGFKRQVAAISATGDRERFYSTIKQPTAIIQGKSDPLMSEDAGRASEAAIPTATGHYFDELGHDLPAELVPQFVEIIRNYAIHARHIESSMYNHPLKLRILDWMQDSVQTSTDGFETLALDLWADQINRNPEYGRWSSGVLQNKRPVRWQDIPAVPVTLFRDLSLTCFPAMLARHRFRTSGTTGPEDSMHF